MLSYLKYIFFAAGFGTLLYTNLHYSTRNAGNPDKAAPYNEQEKKMRTVGYGCFAAAIICIILFN